MFPNISFSILLCFIFITNLINGFKISKNGNEKFVQEKLFGRWFDVATGISRNCDCATTYFDKSLNDHRDIHGDMLMRMSCNIYFEIYAKIVARARPFSTKMDTKFKVKVYDGYIGDPEVKDKFSLDFQILHTWKRDDKGENDVKDETYEYEHILVGSIGSEDMSRNWWLMSRNPDDIGVIDEALIILDSYGYDAEYSFPGECYHEYEHSQKKTFVVQ